MSALSDSAHLGLGGEWQTVIKTVLWAWIDDHGEEVVHLHIWIIRKAFKIKDLHGVFALILGDHP